MTNFYLQKEVVIPTAIKEEVDKLHPANKLFGSRWMDSFFGYEGKAENSDWDFAFPYGGSEQIEVQKATSLGWVEKPTEKYKDNLHFITWEKFIDGYKVQMCSKINLNIFISTFRSIEPDFYWKYLHKSSKHVLPKEVQKDIFNQLYTTKGY